MLDGFKKIVDGLQEVIDPINPLVTNLTEKNKEIASGLLASGFTIKEIIDFVDVSRPQLDPFLSLESEVIKRIATKAK